MGARRSLLFTCSDSYQVVFPDPSEGAPLSVPPLLLAAAKVALKALHEATRLATFRCPAVGHFLSLLFALSVCLSDRFSMFLFDVACLFLFVY